MNTIKQDGSRTIGEISLEAQLLYTRLSQMQPDEIVTYDELSNIAARNVKTLAYPAFLTARKRCEELNNIVFGIVAKVGIRRLLNDEIPETAQSGIDRIRRTAKRHARKLACVDYAALSEPMRTKHNINMSLLGVLGEISKTGRSRILEDQVKASQSALPIGRTLELFRGV